jgi:putative transcriptional regulator
MTKLSIENEQDIGLKLLQSAKEMKAGKAARVTKINEVTQARKKSGLSQVNFAKALHISKRTLQEWEQGRRVPSGAAKVLIKIVSLHPEIVNEIIME